MDLIGEIKLAQVPQRSQINLLCTQLNKYKVRNSIKILGYKSTSNKWIDTLCVKYLALN